MIQHLTYRIGNTFLDKHKQRTELYYRYRLAESLGMLAKPFQRVPPITTQQNLNLITYWTIRRWENEQ